MERMIVAVNRQNGTLGKRLRAVPARAGCRVGSNLGVCAGGVEMEQIVQVTTEEFLRSKTQKVSRAAIHEGTRSFVINAPDALFRRVEDSLAERTQR